MSAGVRVWPGVTRHSGRRRYPRSVVGWESAIISNAGLFFRLKVTAPIQYERTPGSVSGTESIGMSGGIEERIYSIPSRTLPVELRTLPTK
jgi:hypothetical protein